ncbi:MAG TPA: ABC transporter permease, partial [Gemmatimonadales bacterium]|nr:ABC transporter permease [Gemmatimonadales bacterium]
MLARLWRRARAVMRPTDLDLEMDEEIRFHLEMETEEGVRAGLSRAEARRRAQLAFGGLQRVREEGRDARGVSAATDLLMDLRYGLRTLRRSPGFTAVAVLTLALGVGANTAVFTVVNGILLRPLPYPEPASLVSVWDGGHSRAEFTRVRDRNRTLERVAAYLDRVGFSLSGEGQPARLKGTQATADFFHVLRAAPLLGRGFAPGDDAPGKDPLVVLSHGLWRDRFGGDSSVVGRQLDLDGVSRTVIGVMPPDVRFPTSDTELWVPLVLDESWRGFWGVYGHHMIGRLRPGMTLEQLRQDLRGIAADLREENPYWKPGEDYVTEVRASSLQELMVRGSRRMLLVLSGAVGMILLMACANVANLLIARGTVRQREIAIRSTLGASRRRIARQLVTESALLALAGGAAGLGLAFAGVRFLHGFLPPDLSRLADLAVDRSVLWFALGLTTLTAVLFGLIPAARLSRSAAASLHEGSGRTGVGMRQRRLAGGLVAAEIALAVVLAIGSGLLIRSFRALMRVEPGFNTHQVVTARVNPPAARYADPERQRTFYHQLLARLKGSPAAPVAALTSQLPFDQSDDIIAMWVEGYTTDPNRLEVFGVRRVTPEFFQVMDIPLLQGRP